MRWTNLGLVRVGLDTRRSSSVARARAVGAGVAAGVPFGSGVAWPDDWAAVRDRADQARGGPVAPFVAWRFGRVRVSAGVHVDFARLEIARQLDFIDIEGDVAIDMDGAASRRCGGVRRRDAGLARRDLEEPDRDRLLRAPTSQRRRVLRQDAGPARIDGDDAAGSDRRRRAVAARPMGGARGRELTLWTTYRALVIDFANDMTPDVTQRADWHTTLGLRAGPSRGDQDVHRAAGLAWDPSPRRARRSRRRRRTRHAFGHRGRELAHDAGGRDRRVFEQLFLTGAATTSPDSLAARYGGQASCSASRCASNDERLESRHGPIRRARDPAGARTRDILRWRSAAAIHARQLRRARQDSGRPSSAAARMRWLGRRGGVLDRSRDVVLPARRRLVITDPILLAPRRRRGPRLVPPGVALAELPAVDVVLLTHDHHDHFDSGEREGNARRRALRRAARQRRAGAQARQGACRRARLVGVVSPRRARDHVVPARHWSMRMRGTATTRCGRYVVRGPRASRTTPRTAWADHFGDRHAVRASTGRCCRSAATARWFMESQHIGPIEAGLAFEALGARTCSRCTGHVPAHRRGGR